MWSKGLTLCVHFEFMLSCGCLCTVSLPYGAFNLSVIREAFSGQTHLFFRCLPIDILFGLLL